MKSKDVTLSKDILCYILKFFKINGVPLNHIHTLRNIYNSSKSIRQYMTDEQIITIESWKKVLKSQMKSTSLAKPKTLGNFQPHLE